MSGELPAGSMALRPYTAGQELYEAGVLERNNASRPPISRTDVTHVTLENLDVLHEMCTRESQAVQEAKCFATLAATDAEQVKHPPSTAHPLPIHSLSIHCYPSLSIHCPPTVIHPLSIHCPITVIHPLLPIHCLSSLYPLLSIHCPSTVINPLSIYRPSTDHPLLSIHSPSTEYTLLC